MEEILNYLIENGKAWIISQRELHRPQAKALPSGIKKRFGPYFPSDLLELARIRHVPRIENPGFFATLEQIGQPIQFDFRRTAGITFFDTILIAKTAKTPRGLDSLYFHECVHIVQYHLLGIDNFIEQYVNGWGQNGFSYHNIPLEQTAYDLQRAFEANPQQPFSVEAEVKRQMGFVKSGRPDNRIEKTRAFHSIELATAASLDEAHIQRGSVTRK